MSCAMSSAFEVVVSRRMSLGNIKHSLKRLLVQGYISLQFNT